MYRTIIKSIGAVAKCAFCSDPCIEVILNNISAVLSRTADGAQYAILQGNLSGYKGVIFENPVADFFVKMGRKLYYYHKDSGLEIDSVIRWQGKCVPVKAKAATGNIKSAKTILNHPEKYHVDHAVKLVDYNVGLEGRILTLPMYMGFLLTEG